MPDLIDGGVSIKLFADDVKLVKLYTNITLPPDVKNVVLQEHLDKLAKWANDWQLPISYSKCCVMSIGRDISINHLERNDHILNSVKDVADLGVTYDCRLSFSQHIVNIVTKARIL